MKLSDLIAEFITASLEDGSVFDIRRSELAERFGCAPSQINYVITTRFSPENGYIVESRRGGGGYLRIRRVITGKHALILHSLAAIGSEIDAASAIAIISNLRAVGAIDSLSAALMHTVVGEQALKTIPPDTKALVRADLLKRMLLVLSDENSN